MKTMLVSGVLGAAIAGTLGWKTLAQKTPALTQDKAAVAAIEAIEQTIDATGSVTPLNRVEIKPPVSGRIEQLLVSEGTRVKAGQTIAWMSSTDRAAVLDAARARGALQLEKWMKAYNPTPIVAPLDGQIILRNVVVGQTVDATTVLYAMADTLIVEAQVDESDISRLKTGMITRIVLDAYRTQTIAAKVTDILYEGKNTSNVITYGVKVKPDHAPSFFRSQMTAKVSFIAGRKPRAVVIPTAAVDETTAGKRVLVAPTKGVASWRTVETGIDTGSRIEITKGLAEGEKVVYGRGKYTPEQAQQDSPLAMGLPKMGSSSRAAKGAFNGPP